MPYRHLILCLVLALTLAACASAVHTCRVGSDCASGVCMTDGQCSMPRDTGPLVREDASGLGDTGTIVPGDDAATVDDSGVRVCSGNHDGVVSRDEVPLRAGLHATFRVAQDTAIDTAGGSGPSRTWDLSGALSGDADARVDLLDPSGTWWSADYPLATYAATLSVTSDNLGVFRVTDTELQLLAVVSPSAGPTRTNLAYAPPVTVLSFPVQQGGSWMTTSTVTGLAVGVTGFYTETYTSTVDASGTLITPLGSMDVLRVRTDMQRTSGIATLASSRTFGFVAECFGTAATITSRNFEASVEFTHAAEVRRLAP